MVFTAASVFEEVDGILDEIIDAEFTDLGDDFSLLILLSEKISGVSKTGEEVCCIRYSFRDRRLPLVAKDLGIVRWTVELEWGSVDDIVKAPCRGSVVWC